MEVTLLRVASWTALSCLMLPSVSGVEGNVGRMTPNIVVFLVDDLGIGDLPSFGNASTVAPNIDRLRKEGVSLTHHLAAASFCTPSRSAFLTGRYPVRTGLIEPDNQSPPVIVYVSGRAGLDPSEYTWARLLQDHGYSTSLQGKWHLGWDRDKVGDGVLSPKAHGFDSFLGLPYTLVEGFEMDLPFWTFDRAAQKIRDGTANYVLLLVTASFIGPIGFIWRKSGRSKLIFFIAALFGSWFALEHFSVFEKNWWQNSYYMEKYLNSLLMEQTDEQGNSTIVQQPLRLETLAETLTDRSVKFLKEAAAASQDSSSGKTRPFALFHSFTNVHTPLVVGQAFSGKSRHHGAYGDSITEMDHQVGRILDTLDEIGEAKNTLVYFTSDHGAVIQLGSNGPFKGGKGMGAHEGGIRVPGIIRWPGHVRPNSEISTPTSLMDFMPTLADILATPDKYLPNEIDGKSYLPLLKEPASPVGSDFLATREKVPDGRFLRHYCGYDLHSIRLINGEGGPVYKAWFKRPRLNSGGFCGTRYPYCPCYGSEIEDLTGRVEIFNLSIDPYENAPPLDMKSKEYKDVLDLIMTEYIRASEEDLPTSQLGSYSLVMPRPWMQPCANFPRCTTEK